MEEKNIQIVSRSGEEGRMKKYLRELSFGEEALNIIGNRILGFNKSFRISIVEPNVDVVDGGELGDSGTHLTGADKLRCL